MLCFKCKNEIENDSKFCPFCGEPLIECKQKNRILFTLKPVFLVNRETLLINVPGYLFISFFLMLFFGFWFLVFGPIFIHYALKGFYELSVYDFYPDRIEYYNSFIFKRSKILKYKYILNAELKKGIIQEKYNLGTIFLSSGRMDAGGGMRLFNILNPDMNYAKIMQLINQNE